MNCVEITPHLEALALDALDKETRVRVERHLVECEACRRTAQQYAQAAHALPEALAMLAPLDLPASLKQNVMNAAQAEVQAHAMHQLFAPRALPIQARPARAARALRWLSEPRHSLVALGSATAIIAILFISLLITQLQLQQILADVESLRHQTNTRASQATQIASVPSKDILMLSASPNSDAYAIVSMDAARGMFVVRAYGLEPLAADKEYVVWATTAGITQRVGTLTPYADGSAVISFLPSRNLLYYKAEGTTATAELAAQNPPILKKVWITRQFITSPLPSNDRVLFWQASSNEEFEEFDYWFPILPQAVPNVPQPQQPIRYE